MKNALSFYSFVLLFIINLSLIPFASAESVNVRGRILNGTTGQEAEAEEVKLIELSQGMKVLSILRNVKGSYHFDSVELDHQVPHMIQVNFKSVNYSTPLKPGHSFEEMIETTVYETTSDPGDISIAQAHWIFMKEKNILHVEQVFVLENNSETPRTFAHPEETFRFYVPQEAETDPEVSVSSGKMPIKQPVSLIDGTDFYAIHYPIKPGKTQVMIRYQVPYGQNTALFKETLPYDIERIGIFTSPPDIQVQNSRFTDEGMQEEIGFALRQGRDFKKGETLEMKVSGGTDAAEPQIITVPNRTQNYLVYFCSLFFLILLSGMIPALKRNFADETQKHRQMLIQKLVQLHEKFIAGQMSEKEYEKQKNHLKSQWLYLANQPQAKTDA